MAFSNEHTPCDLMERFCPVLIQILMKVTIFHFHKNKKDEAAYRW